MINRGKDNSLKISIGIISRGRPNYLSALIMNWLSLSQYKENIQFVVALDDDDQDSVKAYYDLKPLIKYYGADSCLLTEHPTGYINLYKRNNQMLPHYTGDLLLMVCDDQFVFTPAWDKKISDSVNSVYEKQKDASVLVWMCGANNKKPHPDLYALNRKWLDIAGKYTITAGTDAYVRDVSQDANLSVVKPDVIVYHLQRKFGHLPIDIIENHRKPPSFEEDKNLWELKYGEELVKDKAWMESTRHNDRIYRFHHDDLGNEYNSIIKKFKDYYGR